MIRERTPLFKVLSVLATGAALAFVAVGAAAQDWNYELSVAVTRGSLRGLMYGNLG